MKRKGPQRRLGLLYIWFKELFSPCSVRERFIELDELFIVCGHRGSPAKYVENTIPSFEAALAEGANALEIDLCITKDNVVVIWHDWNPDSPISLAREKELEPDVKFKPFPPDVFNAFRKSVRELNLEEFRKHFGYIEKGATLPEEVEIPTLEEFFNWANKNENLHYVFLEFKTPGHEAEATLEIMKQVEKFIEKYQPKFQIIIETFNTKVLEVLKSNYSDYSFSLDSETHPGFVFLPRKFSAVNKAIKYKNDIAIALRPRGITAANWTTYRRLIRYDVRRRFGYNKVNPEQKIKKLIGCTVNDPDEMNCLIGLGIGGMQTDFPQRLVEATKKYQLTISK